MRRAALQILVIVAVPLTCAFLLRLFCLVAVALVALSN